MTPKIEPVIIIKRKAHGKHPHHGGAWKVAFADFMTAMMAFFLVMWIVAQSAATRTAIAAYFRDPGAFETARQQGLLPGAEGGVTSPQPVPTAVASEAVLERAAEDLRKAIKGVPEFAALKDNIEIVLTPEGLQIELLETEKDGFFEVGKSAFRPDRRKLLALIAGELGRLPNKIAIEGHTDSRPYHSADLFSNWELSSERANAARREMQALSRGLGPGQVEAVRGYADTRLRFKDSPLDSRNRRISILVRRLDGGPPGTFPRAPGK
jgi:chemotaxis protein MotB